MRYRDLARIVFFFAVCAASLQAQTAGTLSAEGRGSGPTQAEAVEAAKIAAVNVLVRDVLKRDAVYRDLFITEALKNATVRVLEATQNSAKKWEARAAVSVDEGIAEALYFGRYSTTVGALLDQAEAAAGELEVLLAEAGDRESNGDLSGAENAFRRAESKADEALRYLGPVEDAFFFSSTGNRKAPELKAVIDSRRTSAKTGIARIKASQERLAVAEAYQGVLETLDSIDAELARIGIVVDELYPISSAPASYESASLRAAADRAKTAIESLDRRKSMLRDRARDLGEEMRYPRERAALAADRIDALTRSLRSASSAIGRELFRRSGPVKAALWLADHDPLGYGSVGLMLPIGVRPTDGGPEAVFPPISFDARAEGAFAVGSGGFWCRTMLRADTERIVDDSPSQFLAQSVDAGFYGGVLVGAGFRWEWLRGGDGAPSPLSSVAVTIGAAGNDLGGRRTVPLWLASLVWELPDWNDFSLARGLNLSLETVLRPSTWIRLDGSLTTRTREAEADDYAALAAAAVGFGFRLPVLKPLFWRLGWEGALRAPADDSGVDWGDAEASGAFRFGMEYVF